MQRFDVFDKPMNGLFNRTAKGGLASCIGLLIAAVATFIAVQVTRVAPKGFSVQLHSQYTSPIPLTIDIEVYKNKCDNLAFHFDSMKARAPESVEISKTTTPRGCRIVGRALIFEGDGNFHITTNDLDYQQQGVFHKHISSPESLKQSFPHRISTFVFGDAKDTSLQSLHDVDETANPHFTYFLKVHPIESEEHFGYSVSKYTRDSIVNSEGRSALPGIFFQYSFQPEMLKRVSAEQNILSDILTGVCAFGSFITLFKLFSMYCLSSKSINKRDSIVCSQKTRFH